MIPVNPPPPVGPRYVRGLHSVCEDALRPFIGHYIYCWLRNRRSYWFCPQSVTASCLNGFAWYMGTWRRARIWMRMLDCFH